ncbi:MAG TPA: SPFH domain-containing protein [Tepidisphaeraceae bacterium]|jgi:regulator of protease activity HflC (stomatin/prohibitin superfamily)
MSLDYQASVKEIVRTPPPGLLMLFGLLGGLALCGIMVIGGGANQQGVLVALGIIGGIVLLFMLGGIFTVNPNEAKVLVLFGRYVGSVREPGMYWVNPFYKRSSVSLRIRNFESQKLKVNDHDGNPIEIAAIIVWKVVDSAEATFEVENYNDYVRVQSESALRTLATMHPYDAHEAGQLSLRANLAEVAEQLKQEIQERVSKAGVNVSEARISHLAYSPEIAAAMLRRQQASAIIAARTKIVEGAVSMVEMALQHLTERSIVEMDQERKANMVSNLMVVLCSEHNAQPVLNMGSQT